MSAFAPLPRSRDFQLDHQSMMTKVISDRAATVPPPGRTSVRPRRACSPPRLFSRPRRSAPPLQARRNLPTTNEGQHDSARLGRNQALPAALDSLCCLSELRTNQADTRTDSTVPARLPPVLDGWDDSGAAGLPGAAGRPSRLLRPSLADSCDSNLRGMLLDSMASHLL